jgi:hypothetical protein
MAVKQVTLKKKDGDLYYPKTSLAQVVGLAEELEGKQATLIDGQLDAVNSGVTAALVGQITTNETDIAGIEAKIPAQANDENQLADKDFVNSSIQTLSADLITYNAAGDPFPTKADLDGADIVYSGGVEKAPDEHDYCVVLADETHDGAQARYGYSGGVWGFQFLVNDTPFTSAQNAAVNSGITAEKVEQYDGLVSDMGDYLTETSASETYATKTAVAELGTDRKSVV